MRQEIRNRADIDRLMIAFYDRAMNDSLIGYIFTDVAMLDLGHHLPIIGDFWETMLFRTGDYARHGRNPLAVHRELDRKTRLLPAHFTRWLELFKETTDELFEGETAEFIKLRSEAIAARMLEHIGNREDEKINHRHAA